MLRGSILTVVFLVFIGISPAYGLTIGLGETGIFSLNFGSDISASGYTVTDITITTDAGLFDAAMQIFDEITDATPSYSDGPNGSMVYNTHFQFLSIPSGIFDPQAFVTISPAQYNGITSANWSVSARAIGYDTAGLPLPELNTTGIPYGPVPEPSTMLLLGAGLIGLVGTARRKMRK